MSFPNAVSLRCFIHKQQNLEEKLKIVIPTVKKEIIMDNFGVQEGDVFCKGLVDIESREAFKFELKRLQDRWNSIAPGFYEWFTDTQEETFCNHMISSVCRSAQLSPSDRFTTNSNESANCIVKKWVQFTKSSWPAFVDKFQDLVALQYTETCSAIYGGGEFTLAPALSSFTIEHLEWYKMSIKKRENHL